MKDFTSHLPGSLLGAITKEIRKNSLPHLTPVPENSISMKTTLIHFWQNRYRRDTAVAVSIVVITYLLASYLDFAERFADWAEPLEHSQIDELPFVFLNAALVAIWFSVRRMRELSTEVAIRKQAQINAHESLYRFQKLFEEGLSGNFIADKDGAVIICNAAFRLMSGMAVRNESAFNIAEALGARWQQIISHTAESHPLDFPELVLERPDKGTWVVMARFRILTYPTGEIREVHGYFADITEQYLAEKELSQLFAENRALAGHALQAQEEERSRLAREIHDDLGQYLTAIRLDVATITKISSRGEASIYLDRIVRHAEYIQIAIRRIIKQLRPAALDSHGLVEALQQLIHDWQKQNPQIGCIYNLDQSCNRLPEAISIVLYRIVQEALTNISKHAHASKVEIELVKKRQNLMLKIKDDGIGFLPSTAVPNSFGLTGMRERIESLHGSFALASSPSAGVTITASIPINYARKSEYVENIIG
jgi:signal transduction histidine kinase